jgi:glycosyltransferase involved in cell wall biosynthesis
MRIVFVSYIKSPAFSRPEDWIRRLQGYTGILESLARQHEVVSFEQISYEGIYLNQGVEYRFLNFRHNKLYFPRELHRRINQLGPDVVFVQGLHFPLQLIQLRFKLGRKVKIVVQHHAEKPFTGLKKYWQQLADRCIDAYFFASRTMGEDWVEKGNLRSMEKIHEIMEASSAFSPQDRQVLRSRTGMRGDPVYIWVGRLDDNKDPLLVVREFLRYAVKKPGARLYLVYQNTDLLSAIQELLPASENGSAAVCLVGKIPHEEIADWLGGADFIVSSSHYEGGGIAVCEGMSCGCIPILTDIPSFRMMTANGQCGLLYKDGDGESLFAALMRSAELDRKQYRGKTLKQFSERLSFDAIAGGILRAIDLSGK